MADTFRRFEVTKKVKESDVITSFYLEPCDGSPVWKALAGQYLTLRVPSVSGPVLRTYSISNDVDETAFHRITVKREAAPANLIDIPDGTGSCWLHDEVEPGAQIDIAAPRGQFVLDEQSTGPVVLLSGGVGQTPLLSMLYSLLKSNQQVWFIHACENGDVHAMQDEVDDLAKQYNGRLRCHVVYQKPTQTDRNKNNFSSEGFINREFIQSVLPLDNYKTYLCGPTPFMVAMYSLLSSLGVNKEQIDYEFFGKATSLQALVDLAEAEQQPSNTIAIESEPPSETAPALAQATTLAVNPAEDLAASKAPTTLATLGSITDPDRHAAPEPKSVRVKPSDRRMQQTTKTGSSEVIFARSEKTVSWSDGPATLSLLELAEKSGLTPQFSCRSGICNTCKCVLLEGDVEYFEPPLEQPGPGHVLLCCSKPKGRVVLDL